MRVDLWALQRTRARIEEQGRRLLGPTLSSCTTANHPIHSSFTIQQPRGQPSEESWQSPSYAGRRFRGEGLLWRNIASTTEGFRVLFRIYEDLWEKADPVSPSISFKRNFLVPSFFESVRHSIVYHNMVVMLPYVGPNIHGARENGKELIVKVVTLLLANKRLKRFSGFF